MENEANNIKVQNEVDILLKHYPKSKTNLLFAFEYRKYQHLDF
jgi:hypothetical protein